MSAERISKNTIFVENIEMNQKNNISMIEALKMIEKKYKELYDNIEVSYIMGADNFIKLPTWNDAEKLVQKKF